MDEELEQPAAEATTETPAATPAETLADAMWGESATADKGDRQEPESEEGGEPDETDEPESEEESNADSKAEQKPDDEEQTSDDSDERMLESLSEKAQHRFRELVSSNKELERQIGGFREVIADAQVTPQDMVDLLAYGKAIRTGDYDQARAILAAQARALELASGKAVELGDPLSDYPDLGRSVSDLELTRDHALELARVRRQAEMAQMAKEQQRRSQEMSALQQQTVARVFGEVQALASGWAKSDIDWPAKEQLLVKRAGMIQQSYPPEQWGQMIRLAYDEITDTLKTARPQVRQPQALRPNAIGAGAKNPASMHEALWGDSEAA